MLIKKTASKIYRLIIYEFNFLVKLLFRLLELFGQLFPEDARGCRIRGNIYRISLKKCGKNFQVGIGAKLEHSYNIEIGNDVYIGHGCWLSGIRGGIILEDEVMLGPGICMVSSNHTSFDKSYRFGPGNGKKIIVKRGSWIAANVVLTAGVTIGEGSLIAAGSVITKDVEPFSIVGGVPGKKIK